MQVQLRFEFLSGAIFFSRGVLAAQRGVAEGFEFVAVALRHGQRGERWERARDVFSVGSVRLLHVAGVAENLDVSGARLARVKRHPCRAAHFVMTAVDGSDAVERERIVCAAVGALVAEDEHQFAAFALRPFGLPSCGVGAHLVLLMDAGINFKIIWRRRSCCKRVLRVRRHFFERQSVTLLTLEKPAGALAGVLQIMQNELNLVFFMGCFLGGFFNEPAAAGEAETDEREVGWVVVKVQFPTFRPRVAAVFREPVFGVGLVVKFL